MIGVILKDIPKWKKAKDNYFFITAGGDKLIQTTLEGIKNIQFDFFVQNGLKKPIRGDEANRRYVYIEQQLTENNIPSLINELPSLRLHKDFSHTKGKEYKDKWSKLSWNSFFMDEGLFPYDPSYDRWSELSKKFDITVYDWKRRGDAVLFNLQIPTDSALNRLTYNNIDYKDFILEKIKQTQTITDRPIIVRSHPLDKTAREYIEKNIDVEFSQGKTLYEDLDRSWCMITYNSTSCVESTLYGTPTIVLDPSAVSTEVSQTKLEQIEDVWEPDREKWCKKIAFHQWQGSELTDGYVWNLLKQLVWK